MVIKPCVRPHVKLRITTRDEPNNLPRYFETQLKVYDNYTVHQITPVMVFSVYSEWVLYTLIPLTRHPAIFRELNIPTPFP